MRFIYKKLSVIIICVLFLALGFVSGKLINKELFTLEGCVQTPLDAIAIGKIICERKYPEIHYEEGDWNFVFFPDGNGLCDTGCWMVCFCDKNGKYPLAAFINKDNCEVLYFDYDD